MLAAYYVRENKLTTPPSYSLQNLQQVVTEQVADGKFVKLETFVSFMPRLQVRLDLPTDDIPPDAVKVAAKIPKQFNRTVQHIATYERLGYPAKTPQIVIGYETKTEYPRFIGMTILSVFPGNSQDGSLGTGRRMSRVDCARKALPFQFFPGSSRSGCFCCL